MASKKKKEVPSIFGLFDKKRSEEITQMSKGSTSTQKFLNKTLAPSSREQIASNVIKSSNPTTLSYGNNENYVAQRILAPLPSTPTTSIDIFNKLKEENEMKIKQQNQDKKTDWIDSLKDGYNFGDITKTVLGAVGFGEHSRNDKPIEVDTKAIENMYKNYTEEQLIKEQKNIQNKILTYSKNGAKSPKNKDGKYTLSGVLSMASNENNEKLRNDPEYITLNQIDDVLTEMIQNTRIKNKKYDKGFAGFAEKSTDVLVGGMAKGARGIEGTVKKITGKEDTISEKTYMEKYSDKAMSEANGKVEKALLEMQGSIGQMVPQMVVPAGKASTVLGFANYGGSAYNEAKEQGYTEEQATRYGIVNGTLEMALNKVLPSFKVGGKNIYGKTATDNLTKKIMSKTIGNEAFKRWIIDASGEFTEEYLQEFLDPIVREALLEENNGVGIIKGKNASEIASNIANYTAKNFFSKENFHAGLLGALNSGLMGAPSAFQANTYTKTTGRSSETGLTQNEQAVIDNIVENRTEELKKSKDKATKKDISKIEQEVRQDLERGYIETSEIERALSNEEWTKHDKIVKQKESLQKELDELNSRTMDKITPPEYKRISELEEQIKNIDTDTTRGELNSAMQGKLTDNDTLLQRAYGEEIEKKNAYQFDKNEKLTEQTKKINEDIEKLGLNNNIKTRDTVDLIKKLSNETGRQYRLIDNNSAEIEKVEGKNVDGFVKNGEVFINVDSENLINRILGHETTHLFEGTEDYTKLQNAAIEYAKTKGEYDSRRSSLEEVYKDIKDANIDNELTSDLVGDYLFSDIEFVRNLSTEQPNIFKKMYNYVNHLYNMATAGSKEARQLEQLKYNFEKVYRENNQSKASNDTKYSIQNKEKNTQELDNSSFSLKQKQLDIIQKNNPVNDDYHTWIRNIDDIKTLEETLQDEDWIDYDEINPDLSKQDLLDAIERGKITVYSSYPIEQGVFVSPSRMEAESYSENGKVYSKEVNTDDVAWIDPTQGQYAKVDNGTTKYSLSVKEANTGTDNNGVKLSKKQQEYFKDSKATDENGNLITVYHTTTDAVPQFNEFNPVGTDYYKFGDQVVNYYTNSKNMSGSYADQEYVMADTKKITSMEEAKSLVKQMNEGLASENTIRIETKDKGYQLVNNIYKEAYEYAKSIWDNEITPEEKQIEKDYEELYKRYVESGYDNNLVPEFTSLENYAKDYAQKLDRITDNMTPEERDAFLSFRKPEFVSVKTEPVIIGEYNSEKELFRNLKQDIQKANSIKNKYQYEGYVNITNPYVVDAEGRNWNKVESKEDSKTTTNFLNLDTLTKDRLTQLAKDSKKRYEETYNEYKKWNDAKNSISGNLRNDNDLNTRLGNRFIEESTLPFVKEFINDDYNFEELEKQEKGLGKIHELRVNTDVMYNLYNNDFIPYSVYNEFNNSLIVPEEIREKVKEIINQTATYNEYDSEGHNSIKKQAKLIDIWENYLKSYKAYDNNGRYDYSIFDRQLLDGYLKEELGNNFVVRDEFGTYDWVLKDLYKVASHEFNEDFIRGEYNDWSVTNDMVKSIIALNKAGENYDGVIIKNVVDYGGDSDTHEANDLYITFNSNQFKAVDNTNPTDDADIRYRLSNKNDIAPISNNDIRARDMLLPRQQEIQKAIAPIQEENKVLKQEVKALQKEVRDIQENNAISYEEFEEYNKRIAPLLEEQEAPPEVEQVYDNLKDTTRMPKKEVKLLSKNIKDTLGLTNKQKLDLEEIIQDYSTSETATREDLYNDIKQRYGKQAIITEYEDIRNVQRKVKSMKLDVADNIKHDIADYNMLKQKNFGKLSFSRNGQPVDSVYQELSSEYPNYFPSNIYNETDQFLKIVDVANLENKSVEELNLDDNYIRETSDYIYESILDSKQDAIKKAVEKISKESLQGELKAPLPVSFDTSDIDANNAVDEVRLMEHKARKKSQVDKGNGKRAPFDWSTFEEVGRKLRAGEDANSIAELNKLDAEAANKQIEEQKKLKPKNESTLKKSLTYGQYLFTNRNVEIDNYAKETGNHNIQVLADHINNIQGEITTNINNSQTDNNGNTIGKSITNIFSQADKAGLSEAFNDYLFHLSNIERHKWGKGSQVPGIDSSILIEEYEKTYPEMKKWAKEVNKYNKNLLYKQADAGLITKELADSLSEMYEFYVPFMENLEGEYTPDKTNSIKTRSTVKRAKGGASRNLLSFEDAMIRQTESAITQIRKNQLYQEIVKTKENANIDFESNTNPDIHDNGLFSDNGKYYLTAYVDGKATQVEIDKSLYHGLAQEGNKRIRQAEQKLSPITKPLQATSNIRRNILTTWNPSFMVTNMLKDIQDAPLNSKYAKDMVKNYPRALKEISTGKGEHLEAFLNMYGQANLRGDYNLDSGLSDITKLAENNKNGKGMKFSKDLLKKIPQINEMIEMAPRYAEYLASIENGCSQMEALYNAREVTTNFGRGGIITKALNRNGFTFLNASVQGMSKLVRNFSGENGGRAVVGCIAKATALGIAPALLNALLFGDDDDYEVLPDYIKDNYYLIKTSDKGFIRIPKGRMMSIFGSAARRTLEGIQGRENPYEGYLSNAYNQVGVQNPSESNIFAPLIQAKNNKTWYGTDLVPKRLQTNKEDGTKIPAKDQYDASTDKMSIWLGEKLNISPYKINYVIDQYSGGIGDIILPMMTEEAQSGYDSTTGKMVAPLKDKFTADSITDNKYVTNFYSKLEELGEKKNATGSKKDEMSYNYMRNISFEMGSLYAEMRKVQADTTLKDSKKYAKVQNIKAEINRLAEEGMKGYKDVETYDNYARVGDRELYKYQSKDGKTGWSDSSGMYADDINNLGLSIKEKDTYYTTKMEMSNVANKFKEDEGAEKYRAVLKTIRNSKLPSDAKYELYNSWYGKSDETSSIIQGLGISANDYLKFKTADLSSTKNKNGYAVRGSKADKVISYLNKTKLSKGQKAVLYRLAFNYKGNYSSSKYSNAYNEEIVRYIDNSSLTYDESIDALKKLGFKVSKDGTVRWD